MRFFQCLFILILALFSLGQLGRIPLGGGEVVLHFNDLVVGFLFAGWVFWHLIKKKKFLQPPLCKPIFLFSLLALFSLFINFSDWVGNWAPPLYLLRWIIYAGLYFIVFELAKEKKIEIRWLFKGLTVVGVLVGGLGILQYLLYPNLRNLAYLGWDPHYFRVFSTFFDPTFTGMILVLTLIPISIFLLDAKYKDKLTKWWLLGAALTAYTALALTYSRGSYLAFLAGMGVVAYLKRAPKFFLAIVLIFALTLVVLPKRDDRIGSNLAREETITARIINWKQSLKIIKDQPLFGVGFNNYRQAQERYGFLEEEKWVSHAGGGADSSLLFVWATTGIFGLLAFLWLGWKIVEMGVRNPFGPSLGRGQESGISTALLASTSALFIHSFFSNSLFYPWIMEWFWILAALVSVEKLRPD